MPRRGMPDRPKQPGEPVSQPVRTQPDKYGALGTWQPEARYLFGSPQESEQFRQPANKYDVKEPSAHAPRFRPIPPGGSGKSLNEPALTDYTPTGRRTSSGHKFSGGIPR